MYNILEYLGNHWNRHVALVFIIFIQLSVCVSCKDERPINYMCCGLAFLAGLLSRVPHSFTTLGMSDVVRAGAFAFVCTPMHESEA